MDPTAPDYQQLLQRLRDAERVIEDAVRARQDAERAQQDAERAREEAEEITRQTTLPEFLDACHVNLHLGLTVQTDVLLSTRGDPSNANNKVRPDRILPWADFPTRQEAIWDILVRSDFMREQHFTSRNTLRENGEAIRGRMMGSELDLHIFERIAVEDQISLIVSRLHKNPALRTQFRLRGSVGFENHSNTLSPEVDIEEDVDRLNVSGKQRRRSPRLLAQGGNSGAQALSTSAASTTPERRATFGRPRADQFCVYNISDETSGTGSRIPAFITEYKPPHKLTLGHIYEGLDGIEDKGLEDIVCENNTDELKERCQRLVAAAITQVYSYMIRAGLEFGCLCTGEASVFLRVDNDPRTVFYFLSVPKGDVGESTGWQPEGYGRNRLHLTAVGQMLAFTLQALQTSPRGHAWRSRALEQLHVWEVVYNDILDAVPPESVPSSEYRPPREDRFLRASPIRLRRPQKSPRCESQQDNTWPDDRDEDGFEPDTPSRPRGSIRSQQATQTQAIAGSSAQRTTTRETSGRQYCTQTCLRGLVNDTALDKMCPNVQEHGHNRHRIDQQTFLSLMRQQLAEDMDDNFAPLGLPGARGVPFMVRLASHGYTLVAKCTPPDFAPHLFHEHTVYKRLESIQGVHVPVNLGSMVLPQPYQYEGIAELTHIMFLSFGGTMLHRNLNANSCAHLTDQVMDCLRAIHKLNVLHRDAKPRNILVRAGQVMLIDFERAEIRSSQQVLGVISPNRKRRSDESDFIKQQTSTRTVFSKEMEMLAFELRGLVPRFDFVQEQQPSALR